MPVRRYALALVLASTCWAACSDDGTAPSVSFSTEFADGRTCRDADVTTITVGRGTMTAPLRFDCAEAATPGSITATDLPLTDPVPVIALSDQGARLYSGKLVAADALAAPMPALVVLYPDQAR